MDCYPIPSSQVLEVWGSVRIHLARALDYFDTGFSEEDVLTFLQLSEMQLWASEKCACVTMITVYPQYKTLNVCYVGGADMDDWFNPLMDMLEDYARQMDCKYVEEWGRPGWEKIGRDRGYEKAFTVMRKHVG